MNSFSPQREIFLVLARHHIVVCPCLPSSPPPPPQPFSSSSFFLYSAAAAAIVLPLSPASRTHTHTDALVCSHLVRVRVCVPLFLYKNHCCPALIAFISQSRCSLLPKSQYIYTRARAAVVFHICVYYNVCPPPWNLFVINFIYIQSDVYENIIKPLVWAVATCLSRSAILFVVVVVHL